MDEAIVGIDLGTTNSSLSYLKDGEPIAVQVEDGLTIIPSIVSYDEKEDRIIVGKEAHNRLIAYPNHSVRSIKRLMGEDTDIKLGPKTFTPEEISSFILKYLAENGSKQTGLSVQKAVITVPAYFNDVQRRATIKAGELAGLEVLRIINEPTAASLVYDYVSNMDKQKSPYILVYDLGGGTFDVSILEVKGEIKSVLASCGDTSLGGDDFDDLLINLFLDHIKEKTGKECDRNDRALVVRLKDIAEKTKIKLSNTPYVNVKEAAVVFGNGESVNLDLEVSRQKYESLITPLVDKTIEKADEALKEANLSVNDIEKVLLVGGATKTPLVQESLSNMFNKSIYHGIDPDLCVSLGAAVQSGLVLGQPLGHILIDVTAHSLGVKTADRIDFETQDADYFSVIIRRNTKIPVRKAEVYYTMYPEQSGVDIEVYQGESLSCKNNTLVGDFYFPLQPSPINTPVTTEFSYDKEGIVHITVEQKGYSNRKDVTLDVRKKEVKERDNNISDESQILNYIIEKYKKLIENKELNDNIKTELKSIGSKYEKALKEGKSDSVIDELEDELLEKIEEAEEILVKVE